MQNMQNKWVKRMLAWTLAVLLVVSMIPTAAFAEEASEEGAVGTLGDAPTAEVSISFQMDESGFYIAKQGYTVSADLSESFGYTDDYNGSKVTGLDVLVAAHYLIFGDALTSELTLSSSGYVTKVMGETTSNFTYFVNGVMPNDGVLVNHEGYGEQYTGYSVSQSVVESGDDVSFNILQDSYYMDQYTWFSQGGEKVEKAQATAGKDLELELSGYMAMFYGLSASATQESKTEAVADAQLAIVDIDDSAGFNIGSFENIVGAVTDDEGKVTLNFAEEGTYIVSAYNTEGSYPLIAPWLVVEVEKAPEEEPEQGSVYIALSKDGKYVASPSFEGYHLTYTEVPLSELSKISLSDYGAQSFAYDENNDGKEDITLLHLFIYTMETYYGNDTWKNVEIEGTPGSMYLKNGFWGHTENLTYYYNGAYPLAREGWGATADQIVLQEDDFFDVQMFTDWDFYSNSKAGYHYFLDGNKEITHEYTVVEGEPLELHLGRAWGSLSDGGKTTVVDEASYPVYYGTEGAYPTSTGTVTTNSEGKQTITFPQKGEYCLWVDGAAGESTESIVSSPGYAKVIVTEAETENEAPVLKAEPLSATIGCNTSYEFPGLGSGAVFEDPEGNELSYFYELSTDGTTWGEKTALVPTDGKYTLLQEQEGTVEYRVYAYDGNSYSAYWAVTLTVEPTHKVTFYVGQDANGAGKNPVIKLYPTTGYSEENATDTFDEAQEITLSGGEIDESGKYRVYTAVVPEGSYSYRAFASEGGSILSTNASLGGMSIRIPVATNVDGTGGSASDVYLRVNNIYTSTKKNATDYFAAADFFPLISCAYFNCSATPGEPYVSGNYTYYPTMLYAGGNACLYNMYVYPNASANSEGYTWSFGSSINATVATGQAVVNKNISMASETVASITAPVDATVEVFWQRNNFHTEQWESAGKVVNGDTATWTYNVPAKSGNFTYRVTKDGFVTESGFMDLKSTEAATLTVEMKYEGSQAKTHDRSGLGTAIAKYDEADIMTNVSNTSSKSLGVGETFRLRNYRIWEIVSSVTGNIMLEPDFNIEVLAGGEHINIQQADLAYSKNNWVDITGVSNGVAILAVSYDALSVNGSSTMGGLYPATSPERTAIVVLNVGGAAASTSLANGNGNAWNYNYDTFYFSGGMGIVSFEAGETQSLEYAFVSTTDELENSLSSFTAATLKDGTYSIPVTQGGTLVLKFIDEMGTSYQCVRVNKVNVIVENKTEPGAYLSAGDTATVTFEGLYRSIFKMSGIFNPGVLQLNFNDQEGTVYSAKVNQYLRLDNASLEVSIPEGIEPYESFTLPGGYIKLASMFAYANPWEFIYTMGDEGTGTNFNAVNVTGEHSTLPEVSLMVGDPNKVALHEEILAAEKIENVGYSTTSWAEFENALSAAKTVLDKEDATKDEIDTALANLKSASEGLGIEFIIEASAGSGGKISPSGTVTVENEKSQKFTITADSGYEISEVKVDDKQVSLSNGTYTFSKVTANHSITASFKKKETAKEFTIKASAGSGGKISPSGNTIVAAAKSKTFTITPNANYMIKSVTVDGKNVGAVKTYTFKNVTAAHTISATFEAIPVNKKALQTAISAAKKLDSTVYTTTSWSAFKAALTSATKVNSNKASTQKQVDNAAAALKKKQAALVKLNVSLSYTTYVQGKGWTAAVSNGKVGGVVGQSKRLEALKVSLTNNSGYAGGIQYGTRIQKSGWQKAASVTTSGKNSTKVQGGLAGTTGKNLRVETFYMKLTGEFAKHYDIYYRVNVQNIGWMGWAKNGEYAGTISNNLRVEAVQIYLVKKGKSAPATSLNGAKAAYAGVPRLVDSASIKGSVNYGAMVHIQNVGNKSYTKINGSSFIGTSGKSLRLEALKLSLIDPPTSGGISYRTHIQNIGWQAWKSNGALSGTTGKSLRLEAVSIKLTGDMAKKYDIYYRTHVQNIGWTGWAKNGQNCGSSGYSYRMEAMQIVIVKKGTTAPGLNSSYMNKR